MPEFNEKLCTKCGLWRGPEFWKKHQSTKDGLQGWCVDCMRAYRKAYSQEDRNKIRSRERYHSDAGRNYWLQRQFGITVAIYNDMLASQGHVCAICNQPCRSGRRLAVDHNHRTGEVRGLLCLDCNTAIGKFQDSSVIAYQAARYLERSGA